jgi:hypothetical protein
MEIVFSPSQLVWAIVFFVLVAVGIYATIALKKIGKLAQDASENLGVQYSNVNRLIPEMNKASREAMDTTKLIREQTGAARELAEVIGFGSGKRADGRPSRTASLAMFAGKAAGLVVQSYVNRKKA